jgi:hypothetical protein
MKTEVSNTSPTPGMPLINEVIDKIVEDNLKEKEIFILSYKKGHAIINMNFEAADLKKAVDLGRELSRKRGYIFIQVTPFLRDINRMIEQDEN